VENIAPLEHRLEVTHRLKQDGSPFDILVVEDNPVNQKIILLMLKKFRFSITVADNGKKALEILKNENYDLVLMDIQMPEMDGFEVTKNIRDRNYPVLNHDIPIVAMTAHAMQQDREKCLSSGMNDYISKPIEMEKLVAVLDKWLLLVSKELEFFEQNKTNLVFDKQNLLRRMEDDENLCKELLKEFPQFWNQACDQLKQYLQEKNLDKVEKQAHLLKGMSANINAERLRSTAIQIEKLAIEQGKDFTFLVSKLDQETDLLFSALKSHNFIS
jgi:CheY-like chemotaxis protein/HPt (histidine-containing phosphotransfer) domain-containing protein